MKGKKLSFLLNRQYCKSCGICYERCPRQVLVPDSEGKPQVDKGTACIFCRLCEFRCPDFAIRVEGTKNE